MGKIGNMHAGYRACLAVVVKPRTNCFYIRDCRAGSGIYSEEAVIRVSMKFEWLYVTIDWVINSVTFSGGGRRFIREG